MVMRGVLTLILVLATACLGALGWMLLAPEPPQPAPVHQAAAPPPRQTVLAAARPLRAGNLLGPEDLAAIQADTATLPEGTRPDTAEARAELLGGMLRRSLAQGEPLRAGEDVLRPGDRGFLAAVLAPGKRAVSINVDLVSGAAGLIWPGDRVDMLLTQSLDDSGQSPARRFSGETVLADLRVIAIDQTLVQGAVTLDRGGERTQRTVTLEVSPEDAERVAVAKRLGHLALSVRAALPGAEAVQHRAPLTWGGDVSSALQGDGGRASGLVRIFQGPSKTEEIRF
jgi:pilus assembly protein CpaB